MTSKFQVRKRVEFAETDMAGIVHFSNYFRYMEVVEHSFFRSLGLSVYMPFDEAILSWPRVSCSFEYKRPMRFEDEVDLVLNITKVGAKSLTYTVDILLEEDVIAQGTSKMVCCLLEEGKMKSIAIPSLLLEKFAPYLP